MPGSPKLDENGNRVEVHRVSATVRKDLFEKVMVLHKLDVGTENYSFSEFLDYLFRLYLMDETRLSWGDEMDPDQKSYLAMSVDEIRGEYGGPGSWEPEHDYDVDWKRRLSDE